MTKEQAIDIYMDKENQDDIEVAKTMYQYNYLTINKGRDGIYYAWFLDENKEWAIDVNSRELSQEEIREILE